MSAPRNLARNTSRLVAMKAPVMKMKGVAREGRFHASALVRGRKVSIICHVRCIIYKVVFRSAGCRGKSIACTFAPFPCLSISTSKRRRKKVLTYLRRKKVNHTVPSSHHEEPAASFHFCLAHIGPHWRSRYPLYSGHLYALPFVPSASSLHPSSVSSPFSLSLLPTTQAASQEAIPPWLGRGCRRMHPPLHRLAIPH